MKIFKLLFLMIAVLSVNQFYGQSVPVATNHAANDQFYMGPCGLFAAVAAYESRAIQSGIPCLSASEVDFWEWNLWSECAVGGSSTGATNIAKSAAFISNYWIFNNDNFNNNDPNAFDFTPNAFNIPNTNCDGSYGFLPGFAIFQNGCPNADFCYDHYYKYDPDEGTCIDFDEPVGKRYSFELATGRKFKLIPRASDNELFIEDIDPSEQDVIDWLSAGYGVIASMDNWLNSGIGHFVFIYAYNPRTGKFSYRDSWPGHSGNYPDGLSNLNQMTTINVIVGSFEEVDPAYNCDNSIEGDNIVSGAGKTYSLESPNFCSVEWSVDGNLEIIGSNTNPTVTVRRKDCSGPIGFVKAEINGNCDLPPKRVTVRLLPDQPSVTPSGYPTIELALGETLSLTAYDGEGEYNWYTTGSLDIQSQSGQYCVVQGNSYGFGNYYVYTTNECGDSPNAGGAVEVIKGNVPKSILIYPNPVKNILTVDIRNFKEDTPYSSNKNEIFIYNKFMSLLKYEKFDSKVYKIDLSELKSGVYIMNLSIGSKIFEQKIIVQ